MITFVPAFLKMTTDKLEKQDQFDTSTVQSFESESPGLRPEILRLMGYPISTDENDYEQEDISPDWDAVLEHLKENPVEASYKEGEDYPLDDALWIQKDPVPSDVIVRLLRANPDALTPHTFEIAEANHCTSSEVMRLLRAADVNDTFTGERTELVQLMGFPTYKYDNDYDESEIEPDWEAVRKRLVTHPEEANVHEDGCYPLEDAVTIEWDPVPLDVVDTLVRLAPLSLTDAVFEKAGENEELDGEILRFLFKADGKIQKKIENSYVKVL